MWIARQSEPPADLDVLGTIDEAEQGSVTKEAEEAAAKILEDLEVNADRQRQAPEESCGSPENISGDATERAGTNTSAIQEIEAEINRLVEEKDYEGADRLERVRKSLCDPLLAERPAATRNSRRGHGESLGLFSAPR